MTEQAPSSTVAPVPATPVKTTTETAMSWTDVSSNLLHYAAGFVILYLAYKGVEAGKISADVFTPLLFGAAAAVGFKMSQ